MDRLPGHLSQDQLIAVYKIAAEAAAVEENARSERARDLIIAREIQRGFPLCWPPNHFGKVYNTDGRRRAIFGETLPGSAHLRRGFADKPSSDPVLLIIARPLIHHWETSWQKRG